MNRAIRADGINREQVAHAVELAPDQWHMVDFQRCAGISFYNRENLITRLADLIAGGHIYWLDIDAWRGTIDRAGNIWLDHEYLAPHQYLPKLITP